MYSNNNNMRYSNSRRRWDDMCSRNCYDSWQPQLLQSVYPTPQPTRSWRQCCNPGQTFSSTWLIGNCRVLRRFLPSNETQIKFYSQWYFTLWMYTYRHSKQYSRYRATQWMPAPTHEKHCSQCNGEYQEVIAAGLYLHSSDRGPGWLTSHYDRFWNLFGKESNNVYVGTSK